LRQLHVQPQPSCRLAAAAGNTKGENNYRALGDIVEDIVAFHDQTPMVCDQADRWHRLAIPCVGSGDGALCGLTLDLRRAREAISDRMESDQGHNLRLFPIGGTPHRGNAQANQHFDYYWPLTNQINRVAREENDALMDEGHVRGNLPVLVRHNQQIYGETAHKTRSQDGLHASQRGLLTAVLSARFSGTTGPKVDKLMSICRNAPPWSEFSRQIESVGIFRGVRFEPTSTLYIQNLPPNWRDGESVEVHHSWVLLTLPIYLDVSEASLRRFLRWDANSMSGQKYGAN
jgi:hypothetical protein